MQKEFDVALSFAGEDRRHAKELADLLDSGGYKFFYDEYKRAELWGKDLLEHLSAVYKDQAYYCVVFLSESYAEKWWPRHELRSAAARAFMENREYILPVRLDDTEIPGILPTVMYLDLREMSIEEVFQVLEEKLSATPQMQLRDGPSLATEHEPAKNRCRNCHFLAKYASTDGGQTLKWTWNAKERSALKVNQHYGVECAKGIWSAGIDPEINSRFEEELLKERRDCFFLEYSEEHKSMTFDAATELLNQKEGTSQRNQHTAAPIEQVPEAAPLSTEVAVARLKQFLPDPRYRIQLADLIHETVENAIDKASDADFDTTQNLTTETVTKYVRSYESICSTLMAMATVGGRWAELAHCDIWQPALQRLSMVQLPGGNVMWLDMRHYPATLLLYALGLGATSAGRLDFLGRLFSTEVRRLDNERNRATQYLPPDLYFDGNPSKMELLEGMSGHFFPLNDRVHTILRGSANVIIPNDDQYTLLFDKLEILIALNAFVHSNPNQTWCRPFGPYMYRYETSWAHILPEIEGSLLHLRDESPYVKANLFGSDAKNCWRNLFAWYNWLSENRHQGRRPPFSANTEWGKRVVNSVHFGNIRVGDPNQFVD